MKKEIKYRQEIVHFGKLLHERGYVAATDGNLSVRFGPQSILITPSCISKGTMRAHVILRHSELLADYHANRRTILSAQPTAQSFPA